MYKRQVDDCAKLINDLINLNIPSNIKKKHFLFLLVKAFQRRFRQQIINGKIDKECCLISENIAKKKN